MRRLGQLLLALLLLGAGLLLSQQLGSWWQHASRQPAQVQDLSVQSRPATVYFLREDAWLTFPLLSQTDHTRVLTHAAAAAGTPAEQPLQYSLQYQVLDQSQRVLHEGRWTHRTRIPPPVTSEGRLLPRNLYADSDLAVAGGQALILQLTGMTEARYLRLRLLPLDAPLRSVAARVYYEERLTPARASILWERLSQRSREQLSRGVIYPPALILPAERSLLLQRQWQPIGPQESDTLPGRLYSLLGDEEDDVLTAPVNPAGLYLDAHRHGVIPILADGNYLLSFLPLQPDAGPVHLQLSHFGEQVAAAQVTRLSLEPGQQQASLPLTPGILQVQATQPGRFDLRAAQAPGISLLPPPGYLRARHLRPQSVVELALSPAASGQIPLRLDLRLWGAGQPLPASTRLQALYRLYDSSGQLLASAPLQADVLPSLLDRIATTPELADLSEPASFFLRLPPQAARLQLEASQNLLVSAWTRPADLPHQTRVPQDYYAWQSDGERQPGWFVLRPPQSDPQLDVSIHTQLRPPQRDPQLIAGRYRWQSLDPQLQARGARLLLPLQPDDPVRASALPASFTALANGLQTIELQAPQTGHQLRPQLLFLRESSAPFSLRLNIDGRDWHYALTGTRGAVLLPALAPGQHRLHLDASTRASWLLNYRMPEAGGWMLRQAYALEDVPLRFHLQHTAGEHRLLGARFYSRAPAGGSTRIRLQIRPGALAAGAAREWTYTERIYELAPDADQAQVGYLLDQQQGRVSSGLPLLFELGDDLASGMLDIRWERLDGAPGHLVFHEILPGEQARADSFLEIRP